MTIAELLPSVQKLSHTEKLLLLKVLVGELLVAEGVAVDSSLEVAQVSSVTEANKGKTQPNESYDFKTRYDFLQKPLSERQQILAAQADAMQNHYETDMEWKDLMVGDIVEY